MLYYFQRYFKVFLTHMYQLIIYPLLYNILCNNYNILLDTKSHLKEPL